VNKDATINENVKVSKNVAIGADLDNNIGLNIQKTSNTTALSYGIKSHVKSVASLPTGPIYAICGFADASAIYNNYPISRFVGVFGKAAKSYVLSPKFSAGVAGMVHYYGGAAVYGGIGSTMDMQLPSTLVEGAYAGYFDGSVKVNGTLTATVVSTTSDERSKENIKEVASSLAESIQLLKPVSYTLKQDSLWKYDIEAKELQGVHYGLIAQDVQKILPELVYERGEQLSINYTELIPLLIKTVQDLSAELKELKSQLNK